MKLESVYFVCKAILVCIIMFAISFGIAWTGEKIQAEWGTLGALLFLALFISVLATVMFYIQNSSATTLIEQVHASETHFDDSPLFNLISNGYKDGLETEAIAEMVQASGFTNGDMILLVLEMEKENEDKHV